MSDLLRRHGPKVVLGGLVAVNVALIGALALRDPISTAVPAVPVPTSSATAERDPSPSTSPRPTPTATAEPSASAEPDDHPDASPEPSDQPAPGPRLLAASSGRTAWRAEPTTCGGEATVEVSTDGGRSWSSTDPGLTAIVRLKAYSTSSVFAIGADKNCRPTFAWIAAPGERWQRDRDRVDNIWFRIPNSPDLVHAPGGRETRPCGDDLVDLAGLGTYQAAALCGDGRIRTEAEGRSWRTVRPNSGALSLNADDNGFVAALSRRGCDGVLLLRFDSNGDGLGRNNGNCRTGVEAAQGKTAVSQRDDVVWVWSVDRVRVID